MKEEDRKKFNPHAYRGMMHIVMNIINAIDITLGITDTIYSRHEIDKFSDGVKDHVQDVTGLDIERSHEREERLNKKIVDPNCDRTKALVKYYNDNWNRIRAEELKEIENDKKKKERKDVIIVLTGLFMLFLFIVTFMY